MRYLELGPGERVAVVMPTWLGDVVMATPTLRALREVAGERHITCLISSAMRPVLEPCPWADAIASVDAWQVTTLAGRLRAGRFDAVILLPNSFRWALAARLANVRRRIGYDRDGRGWLLSDRLLPLRDGARFVPTPTLDYYLGIARYLGAESPDTRMQLAVDPAADQKADELLAARHGGDGPVVLLNPGASYGSAKLWPADRFAAVADALVARHGATVLVSGAPDERTILDRVHAAAQHELIDLPGAGVDLATLKGVIRRCDLMVTNDTGPRHIAAAFDVAVVTVFGPTDPRWAEVDFEHERQLRVDVACSPCQRKVCPIDHRCMTRIDVDMVLARCESLLPEPTAA